MNNEELTDREKILIQEQNIKMLLRKVDKIKEQYRDMYTRPILMRLRETMQDQLRYKKRNRSYIQGSIDTLDFVLSKKEPKEILLQK
jgi:hypothetical protein